MINLFWEKKNKPAKKAVKKVIPVKKAPMKKAPAKKEVKKPVKTVAKAPEKKAVKMPEVVKMSDIKAYDVLKDSRIPMVPYAFVKKEADVMPAVKKIGFPCVMKVAGKEIIHKTEFGGVIKNVDSEQKALEAFAALMKIKKAENVIIQKQMSGLELIVGAKASPEFGRIISIGIGGIYVEVLRDVTFRIAPLSTFDAQAMVKELKGYEILAGARSGKPINLEKLYELLVRMSNLAVKSKFKEMDINPLFCTEEGCWAADVRIIE